MKEKKEITLKDQYKFSLKLLTISMPIAAIIFAILGIVFCVKVPQVIYVGIFLIGMGIFIFIEFFLIKAYIHKKIAKLENE